MQPALILTELERILSPSDLPIVVAALKEDALIWSTLQQPDFVRSIISDDCCTLLSWSPAHLALKPLGERVRFLDLTADNIPGIEGSLRKQAIDLLEVVIKKGQPVDSLTDAGLIALALRERRRKMQSWRGIFDALTSTRSQRNIKQFDLWKTPLTCLFGMIPDGMDLLGSLLPENSIHPAMEWITHVLLSNPIETEVRAEMFYEVMSKTSLANQVEWLGYLKRKGQSALVTMLATSIHTAYSNVLDGGTEPDLVNTDWVETTQKVLDKQISATLHQFAGHPLQAELQLEKVRELLQHWLIGSMLQLASISDQNGRANDNVREDCVQMLKLFPVSERLLTESMFALSEKSQAFSLSDPDYSSMPLLAKMEQAKQLDQSGSHRQAQEVAYVSIREWLKRVDQDPTLLSGQFIFEFNPQSMLDLLLELGLYSDAIQVAEKFLSVRPEDLGLLVWISDLCHRIGEDEKAINLIYQVILQDPGKPENYRILAGYHEDRLEWTEAVETRKKILDLVPLPAVDDHLALARCAFGGKENPLVLSTCEKILSFDPEQGLAHTYYGMACLASGDLEKGLTFLNKATLLIPENPLPWIQLANAHKQSGETQRALEILRSAIITAPDSAELHFAVGMTCLESNLTSEALPFLRQSAKLDPESDQVGLALASTLMKLGHEPEALEVIEKTRTNWPAQADLAYLHAKILLGKKEIDRGLSVLEIALQSDHPDPEWYILYAKTLISELERYSTNELSAHDFNTLINAHKMIQKAVGIAPESFEAKLLLAEILSLRGEHEAAYAAYKQIVELPEAVSTEWSWRVQAGLGRTALALKQIETALASLQNAVQANPDSIKLQRVLAEAYRQANLNESAQATAQAVLTLAPDEIDNLIWFGEFMCSVDGEEEAVKALHLAREISPNRIDLAIILADTQLRMGLLDEARKELEKIAKNKNITGHDLRKIAQIYIKLGDDLAAVSSLERAATVQIEGNEDIHYELATLYAKTENPDKALDTIQKAILENPKRVDYYLFQSEIQEQSNRPQAAIASLEHALRLIGLSSDSVSDDIDDSHSVSIQDGSRVGMPVAVLADIHVRFSKLLQRVENYGSAQIHAEKALELCPENFETRYLAIDLAMKQLQYEQAEKLAEYLDEQNGYEGKTSDNKSLLYWLGGIYALRAEIAFEREAYSKAAKYIKSGFSLAPEHPRLNAVQIRMQAANGEYQTAIKKFKELLQTCEPILNNTSFNPKYKDGKSNHTIDSGILQRLAEAAAGLYQWHEALEFFEKYANYNPNEPRGLLNYARSVVKAAEYSLISESLQLKSHVAPGSIFSDDTYGKFKQVIADLKKISTDTQIERWAARGEVVFHPSSGSIRSFAGKQVNVEDVSAMVLVMGRQEDFDNARQIGEQYSNDARVNFQLSLLNLKNDSEYILDKAKASVEQDPNNPLYHAALAKAYESREDYENALESLDSALYFWPEEGLWQGWAGKLAESCNEFQAACEHYQQAFELIPDSVAIATRLGRTYLRLSEVDKAVDIFTQTIKSNPDNPELWQYLAEAQYSAGNQREAQVSAETAVRLDPGSSAAKVICGEISLALGNDVKALDMVRAAMKVDPANIRARLLTSSILLNKGKDREALSEISKAVEEIPEAVELHIEKVRLVYKMQGPAEALKLLVPLLLDFPDNEKLLTLQAKSSFEIGKIEEAESAGMQSIRLNQNQPDMHRLLGNIYRQIGQLDKSVHHMSEAIRLSPDEVDIYMELGEVYTNRREFSQAIKTYQQAMKVAPEDYRPFYQSAIVLRDGKDYQGAENMMRRAAQLAPNDVNIRRQLGAIVALNLVQSCQEANTCQ